jgi:hypothetical protein
MPLPWIKKKLKFHPFLVVVPPSNFTPGQVIPVSSRKEAEDLLEEMRSTTGAWYAQAMIDDDANLIFSEDGEIGTPPESIDWTP